MAFAEETGITTGANRPGDITLGELALILANTERVFDAAAEKRRLVQTVVSQTTFFLCVFDRIDTINKKELS